MLNETNDTPVGIPTILVVGSLKPPQATDWLEEKLRELSNGVFSTLERAGSQYQFVEASSFNDDAKLLIAQTDGLLILGGGDADPSFYGQDPTSELYAINPRADRLELDLIQQARIAGKPIFGICRGMQLINIAFGGELYQDIGDGCHSGTFDNSIMVSHKVTVAPDSKLHNIFGSIEVDIRSAHHQAVSVLGEGLNVSAHAPDGIIEAIEAGGEQWVVGVQWHPEDTSARQHDFDLLMKAFLTEVNSRRLAFQNCRATATL